MAELPDEILFPDDPDEQAAFRKLIGEAFYAMVVGSPSAPATYQEAAEDLVVHFVNCLCEAHNANEELFLISPQTGL